MHFKNKLCEIKANLKYKLAESFCRNFALQSRNIAKTILTVSIESKEMNSNWWKNSFNIFCEATKMKMLKSCQVEVMNCSEALTWLVTSNCILFRDQNFFISLTDGLRCKTVHTTHLLEPSKKAFFQVTTSDFKSKFRVI